MKPRVSKSYPPTPSLMCHSCRRGWALLRILVMGRLEQRLDILRCAFCGHQNTLDEATEAEALRRAAIWA